MASDTVETLGVAGAGLVGGIVSGTEADVRAEHALLSYLPALTVLLASRNIVASGQVQLQDKSAIISTGVADPVATFNLALGLPDPDVNAKVAGRAFWDESAGTDGEQKIELVESGTDVGNPVVAFDVERVR